MVAASVSPYHTEVIDAVDVPKSVPVNVTTCDTDAVPSGVNATKAGDTAVMDGIAYTV